MNEIPHICAVPDQRLSDWRRRVSCSEFERRFVASLVPVPPCTVRGRALLKEKGRKREIVAAYRDLERAAAAVGRVRDVVVG